MCCLLSTAFDPEASQYGLPIELSARSRFMRQRWEVIMTTLRSSLNPEEQPDLIQGPTRHKIGSNQWELVCAVCSESYYVDKLTLTQAVSAMEEGRDNPFCCDECEDEYEAMSREE